MVLDCGLLGLIQDTIIDSLWYAKVLHFLGLDYANITREQKSRMNAKGVMLYESIDATV